MSDVLSEITAEFSVRTCSRMLFRTRSENFFCKRTSVVLAFVSTAGNSPRSQRGLLETKALSFLRQHVPAVSWNREGELDRQLSVPIPIAYAETISRGFLGVLTEFWWQVLSAEMSRRAKRTIDINENLSSPSYLDIRMLAPIRRVRTVALARFEKEAAPFYLCRIPRDEKQRRHFPRGIESRATIQKRSETGHSLFYTGIDVPELQDALWYVFEIRFDELRNRRHARVYCDALTAIGASQGVETDMIKFDINLGARDAHAFPVPFDYKALEGIKVEDMHCSVDVLQGRVRSL
jgi:hypothetical protein